jgi:hypothetical protein
LTSYFLKYMGTNDYSDYEEEHGLPYLKQIILDQKVLSHIIDHATME